MPIILDETIAQASVPVNSYSPKFFNKELTGKGGTTTTGLLSATYNPIAIDPSVSTLHSHSNMQKRSYSNGATQVTQIPVNSLTYRAWEYMSEYKLPDKSELHLIGQNKRHNNIYIAMRINSMLLQKTVISGYQSQTTQRTFIPNYQIFLFQEDTPDNLFHHGITRMSGNYYDYMFSSNPLAEHDAIINWISRVIDYSFKDWQMFLSHFDLYDSVVKRSEEWQTTIPDILGQLFENINTHYSNDDEAMKVLENEMKYIVNYNIPLDLYKDIYAHIKNTFSEDIARNLCKHNLNLLLSDTMQNLNQNKHNIQTFSVPATFTTPQSVQKLSTQQKNGVQSTEPLILVQSGAGTGKSTLILARIDYLIACGVQPNDITVISFTNAAADHITEKNPNVNSMTMARMIHEIYINNFPNHDLSSIDTLINSLDIYYPIGSSSRTNLIDDFKRRLIAILKSEPNNFTELNTFIEGNYDDIIEILDTIGQTSLELEIIIAYQQIGTFIEPPTVQSKFLIIDEVQDNSIFEFIYTLKYVEKHQESLFCVGDCSQTLYEFRASNPRALNILEASGTFATYQLTTNYRSKQEILDFANIALQNIEANQYAQIQLQANSLAQVTEQSFLDKVRFNYHRLNRISDFKNALPSMFARELRPYINDCLARGEQVAFLAFTRHDIYAIEKILQVQYPNQQIANLVPEKMFNQTIFSTFIMRYWNEINFVPHNQILFTISQEILARLQYMSHSAYLKHLPKIQDMINDWRRKTENNVKMWQHQVNNGQITSDEMMEFIKRSMLQYEIQTNANRQQVLSRQNQEQKEAENIANANFLLSTIHSAKGLEFENVVVLYKADNQLEEDKKRMYYVAFTRAMKSEYILAYDTVMSPQIQADYMTVLKRLHAIAPSPNSPLNVVPKAKRIKI